MRPILAALLAICLTCPRLMAQEQPSATPKDAPRQATQESSSSNSSSASDLGDARERATPPETDDTIPGSAQTTAAERNTELSDSEPKDQLERLVESLDAPSYRERFEASAKLKRAGRRGIDALKGAVEDGNMETSSRALGILEFHFKNSEELVLQTYVKQVLEEIAEQDDHPKSLAAARILNPPSSPGATARLPAPFLVPPALARPRPMRIQVRIANGRNDITIEENGNSIRVVDTGNGIQVEKKQGQRPATKKVYKDMSELKEKDPAAHRAYQRAGGGLRFPEQPRLQLPGIPAAPPARNRKPEDIRKSSQQRHEELRKLHEKNLRRMRESLPRPSRPDPPAEPPVDV